LFRDSPADIGAVLAKPGKRLSAEVIAQSPQKFGVPRLSVEAKGRAFIQRLDQFGVGEAHRLVLKATDDLRVTLFLEYSGSMIFTFQQVAVVAVNYKPT
jgi:hypothetical protein